MMFLDSRLLGVQLGDADGNVRISIQKPSGERCILQLLQVGRFLVSDMRQQNVIEELRHWTSECGADQTLREAAFHLVAGVAEDDCPPALAAVAMALIGSVGRGEVEMLEITAIYGAQVLATFKTMSFATEPSREVERA